MLSYKQGILQFHPPLTLAETASIFGEMIVFRDLLAKAPSDAVCVTADIYVCLWYVAVKPNQLGVLCVACELHRSGEVPLGVREGRGHSDTRPIQERDCLFSLRQVIHLD